MSKEYPVTFRDLAESFDQVAEYLEREGMSPEQIIHTFTMYISSRLDNAKGRDLVNCPKTFISSRIKAGTK